MMDPDVHALTESELYVLQEEKNMFQFHIYNTNQKYSATDEKGVSQLELRSDRSVEQWPKFFKDFSGLRSKCEVCEASV